MQDIIASLTPIKGRKKINEPMNNKQDINQWLADRRYQRENFVGMLGIMSGFVLGAIVAVIIERFFLQ